VTTLQEKWGSKENWIRCLHVQANMMWLFRQEIGRLGLNELRWLDGILRDTLLAIGVHAPRASTTKEAFDQALELLRANIENRIAQVGSDDELETLLQRVRDAQPNDVVDNCFKYLAKSANIAYGKPTRKVELFRQWYNDHPVSSAQPDIYHVTAHTARSANESTVDLCVHLDSFDPPSLLAIPTLFTHELVCHVYANEVGVDAKSIWAEGVMDWAAWFLFQRWAPQLTLLPYAAVRRVGDDLRRRRMTTEREAGLAIGDTLYEWFCNDGSRTGPTMAALVTVRYVLEINTTGALLRDKDLLASRIANIGREDRLQADLRDWLAGQLPAAGMLA
jgi:hypothetical protein